jgi:hypothetical protein
LVFKPLTSKTSWGISSPFELLSPALGQVTNALLTRSPLRAPTEVSLSVRLACIKHAASVHPEPGSNSPHISYALSHLSMRSFLSCLSESLVSFSITPQLLRCHAILPRQGSILAAMLDHVKGNSEEKSLGDDLLSQGVAPQVPSALTGLTAGFGM